MRHYNITVRGKVQGVSYRFTAHLEGLRLDLAGFVTNLPNGDVYIEAEGDEENINKFIQWCNVGPPLAKVKEVKAEEGELKHYRNFEIRK